MRVLLIEDDTVMAALTEQVLREEKFIVDSTDLGEDGLAIGKLYDYDIIILDLMLPDMDGYEVLRQLRAARVHTPILIMSGRAELAYKVKGFRLGADDFMTKPVEGPELIARIQAIVRRSKGHSEATIRTGKLVVNLDRHTATAGVEPLHLTAKEYGMLELLSLRKGVILTREMFLDHLYGGMDEPLLKILDVFICKLRRKLMEATGGDNYIKTVWGRGYIMNDPAEAGASPAPSPAPSAQSIPPAVQLLNGAGKRQPPIGLPVTASRTPGAPAKRRNGALQVHQVIGANATSASRA